MNTKVAVSPTLKNWRELYKAAILEADSNRLSERIAVAEWALAVRSRELFYADEEHLQERLAVDAAISALQTLRSTRRGPERISAARDAITGRLREMEG